MRRFLLSIALWLFTLPAFAQLGVAFPGPGTPASAGGGGCSPGTNAALYLSNFGGTFDATHTAAACTLINGLDTNSLYGILDDLHILGAQNATDALIPLVSVQFAAASSWTTSSTSITVPSSLNISLGMTVWDTTNVNLIGTVTSYIGTTMGLTSAAAHASTGSTDNLAVYWAPVLNGAPTFAADGGYTGADASSTKWIDTSILGTGSKQCVQNSCTIGLWVQTNVLASASGGICMGGTSGGTNQTRILPRYSNGTLQWDVHGVSQNTGIATTDSRGGYAANRSGSAAEQIYLAGSSIGSSAITSVAAPASTHMAVLANNDSGTGVSFGCGEQIGAYWMGASLTSGQQATLYSLLDAYGASVGWPFH